MKNFRALLEGELSKKDVHLDVRQLDQLEKHYELLSRWGKVHNLTTVLDAKEAAESHYMDSVLGLTYLSPSKTVIDAGSGAGFPGIIAAILWDKTEILLVESSRKKSSFLETAVREVGCKNVRVICGRIEDQAPASLVISRAAFSQKELRMVVSAVKPLGALALWLTPALLPETREELEKLGFQKSEVHSYELSQGAKRSILIAKRST